jgi:hypothetical protein
MARKDIGQYVDKKNDEQTSFGSHFLKFMCNILYFMIMHQNSKCMLACVWHVLRNKSFWHKRKMWQLQTSSTTVVEYRCMYVGMKVKGPNITYVQK